VASSGGHWVQLLRTSPAFARHDILWVSTVPGLESQIPAGRFVSVRDANIWDKPGLVIMALQLLWHYLRFRPHVVFTTGAAPGFFAVLYGRLFGARTIWLDSIANAEELSMAGRKAGRFSDHWLTQWPELAREGGPHYLGTILPESLELA
jgi:hypothetical protein